MEELVNVDLESMVKSALTRSISPSEYDELLKQYAKEGKTTGTKQHEDLIYYTKLNAQRSKRIAKTVNLSSELVRAISSVQEAQVWVLMTESWCGDAANSVPVISKLAEQHSGIQLKLVMRDENPLLMDRFLTNGGRSIPKLIALNERYDVRYTWGPRPLEAQELYNGWRDTVNRIPYKEFQVDLQKWYNQDGGRSLQQELFDLIEG